MARMSRPREARMVHESEQDATHSKQDGQTKHTYKKPKVTGYRGVNLDNLTVELKQNEDEQRNGMEDW
jgi:hypothetical protein